jgi:hypothetical protein
VKEVGNRLGFCTCDYFIRKFRKYYGIVPGQFKEFRMQRSEEEDRSKQGIDSEKSCEACFYRLAYLYKEMEKWQGARNLKNE